MTVPKPPLKILLAAPRGFCAGVDRAIQIVEQALTKFGAPVYVRHEIVHNRYVVDSLRAKGAVFVNELDEIPDTTQPVIFSAHGVAKAIPASARGRNMFIVDATCPLVSKVHMEVARHHEQGREIVLVGHRGHPEVVGTLGQLPDGAIHLIESADEARSFVPRDAANLAYVTQTTLSLDDTAEIVEILKARFPEIGGPVKEDICYATTNRQNAVKAIATRIDGLIVVGGPKSSNSLAPRRGRRARRMSSSRSWSSAPPIFPGRSLKAPRRSASPRAPRLRKSSSKKSSKPFANATTCPSTS